METRTGKIVVGGADRPDLGAQEGDLAPVGQCRLRVSREHEETRHERQGEADPAWHTFPLHDPFPEQEALRSLSP